MAVYLKSVDWNDNHNAWQSETNLFSYGVDGEVLYENIVWERIIDPLHSIIADEFKIPIYFDEHKGNQSFVIIPTEDNLVGLLSGNSGQEREHIVEITYQLKSGGVYSESSLKKISNISEHLKRILQNNANKYDAWFNGQCTSIEYVRDEDDPSILTSAITFEASTLEIFA
tara:strand:- start:1194 stop:1706 length:513 start_codon:yes stop_codon:yes gene_type:complete